jgi:hypothetical protein
MAQPTQSTTHIDVPLSQLSVSYMQKQDNFIASKVFPDIAVDKRSNKYFVFDRATFMRDSMRKRAGGEESAGSGYTLSSDTYYCDVWALHKDISDQDRAMTDSPLDQDRNAVQMLAQAALIRKDAAWAADFFTTGVWGTDNTNATNWDDYTSGTPLVNVDTAKITVLEATGQELNTMVVSYRVFAALKEHPTIVDRIKYTSSRSVTEETLATMFGMKNFLVSKAVVDGAVEGKAASTAAIAGKHALLLHVADAPGIEVPSAGYTFNWTGLAGGYSGMGLAVDKLRAPLLAGDRIEGQMAFDQKLVGSSLGFFFSGILG